MDILQQIYESFDLTELIDALTLTNEQIWLYHLVVTENEQNLSIISLEEIDTDDEEVIFYY